MDGEIVALDTGTSVYLGANASGALLWQRLENGATTEEMVEELASRYNLDAATAAADVERFMAELEAAGLLEDAPA